MRKPRFGLLLLSLLFGLSALLSLGGCAGNPSAPSRAAQGGSDIATASDEGEARRRARIRMELASTYYAQGQFSTALDELKQAVAIDPAMPASARMRAKACTRSLLDRCSPDAGKGLNGIRLNLQWMRLRTSAINSRA